MSWFNIHNPPVHEPWTTKFCVSQLWIVSSWKRPLPIQAVAIRHPKLDLGTKWEHPQAINVAAYDCPESSSGWRIKFRMTTDQVRDDKYRAPHLKEDVSITHCSLCIVHYALWNEVRRKPIMHCALWIMHYIMFARACVCEGCWTIWTHFTVKSDALR